MPRYYHVTPAQNKESILQQGLIPQIGSNAKQIESEPAVYLFTSREYMEDALCNWMDNLFDDDDEIVIFEVNLPDDFEMTLTCDWEVVSYKVIPPEYLTVVQ